MVWASEIVDRIGTIPSSFWGVIAGAAFSLGAVHLTNRATGKRLRDQFAHERTLRNDDRDLSLRKDVYLAVAEAAQTGIFALGKYANLSVPLEGITDEFLEKSSAIAKLHLMAKESTVNAVTSALTEMFLAMLRLTLLRVSLDAKVKHISQLESHAAGFGKSRDRWLEAIQQYNLDGIHNPKKWDLLQHNFDFEHGRVDEKIQEQQASARDLHKEHLLLLKAGYDETVSLNPWVVAAMVEMRTELRITTDIAFFQRIFAEAQEKQDVALRAFFATAGGE